MSFLDLGIDNFCIASTLTGSIFTPSTDTMCPKSLPSFNANNDFFGFNEIPYLFHFRSTLFKCCKFSPWMRENTVMSSKYTKTNLFFSPTKAMSMAL